MAKPKTNESGEKYLLKVVAKHADRYNMPYAFPLQLQRKISVLKEHCTIIGRDYNEIEKCVILRCLVRQTEDELQRNIRKWKRKDETAEHFKKRIDPNIQFGTPDHVVSELKEYVNLGVYFTFRRIEYSMSKTFQFKGYQKDIVFS